MAEDQTDTQSIEQAYIELPEIESGSGKGIFIFGNGVVTTVNRIVEAGQDEDGVPQYKFTIKLPENEISYKQELDQKLLKQIQAGQRYLTLTVKKTDLFSMGLDPTYPRYIYTKDLRHNPTTLSEKYLIKQRKIQEEKFLSMEKAYEEDIESYKARLLGKENPELKQLLKDIAKLHQETRNFNARVLAGLKPGDGR